MWMEKRRGGMVNEMAPLKDMNYIERNFTEKANVRYRRSRKVANKAVT